MHLFCSYSSPNPDNNIFIILFKFNLTHYSPNFVQVLYTLLQPSSEKKFVKRWNNLIRNHHTCLYPLFYMWKTHRRIRNCNKSVAFIINGGGRVYNSIRRRQVGHCLLLDNGIKGGWNASSYRCWTWEEEVEALWSLNRVIVETMVQRW